MTDIPKREVAVRTWDLSIEEFRSCARIDPRFREHLAKNIDFQFQELVDRMGDEVIMSLRIPAMVLQDAKVVASYPDGLWQNFCKYLGFPYRCVEIRLRELVTFPDVELPGKHARHMRVFAEETKELKIYD